MGCLKLLEQLSKVSYPIGMVAIVGALILGWIGFSVPDWLSFTQSSINENKFGLWSFCTHSISTDTSGYSCDSWSSKNIKTPDYLRTVQGLMTIGMIFVTITMFIAFSVFFIRKNIVFIIATVTSFISLLFILVGIIVFAGDYSEYVTGVSGTNGWRRWGYWIFTAVIVLLIIATLFFPYKFLFDKFIKPRLERRMNEKMMTKQIATVGPVGPTLNPMNLVPSRSHPGYYREYRAPSLSSLAVPPAYGTGEAAPAPAPKKKKTSDVDEVNRSYRDASVYEYRDGTVILPGESERVKYSKNSKNDNSTYNETKWDWEKVRKQ